MGWWDLLWGRATLGVATVVLAVAGLAGGASRPWPWIVGSAAFIAVHGVANEVRDRSISRRLGSDYDAVQRRALQLIADLSDLTAREFDLWMIDLYLPRWSISLSTHPPFLAKRTLVRELSQALTDVRTPPLEIELDHGLFGPCFSEPRTGLWWDVDLTPPRLVGGNSWHELDSSVNEGLAETFGAVSVNPLVDGLGKHCLGLLVVHVDRDAVIVTKAIGALTQSEGRRRLRVACNALHGLLGK